MSHWEQIDPPPPGIGPHGGVQNQEEFQFVVKLKPWLTIYQAEVDTLIGWGRANIGRGAKYPFGLDGDFWWFGSMMFGFKREADMLMFVMHFSDAGA